VLEELTSRKLDALIITHLPNVRYLCGFTGSSGVLLLTPTKSVFFTDGRYTTQARAEVTGLTVVISRKSALAAAAEWVLVRIPRKSKMAVGIESEHLTIASRDSLARQLSSRFRLRGTVTLVERLRMIKEADEIAIIRRAVLLGANLFEHILKKIQPGISEMEIAAELEYAARRAGAQEMSFSTIVAAGPRSALPHARASAQRVPRRAFVLLDFGVILQGYCSDMTRTVCVGHVSRAARDVYEAVREAQQAAVDAVRPGASVAEVDGAARKVLRRAKLARYFRHSIGHGVGLEIHELPRVAAGQQEQLHPGTVITIEPGVYIAGHGGVRIEDMVVVNGNGCEVLTPSSKELIVL